MELKYNELINQICEYYNITKENYAWTESLLDRIAGDTRRGMSDLDYSSLNRAYYRQEIALIFYVSGEALTRYPELVVQEIMYAVGARSTEKIKEFVEAAKDELDILTRAKQTYIMKNINLAGFQYFWNCLRMKEAKEEEKSTPSKVEVAIQNAKSTKMGINLLSKTPNAKKLAFAAIRSCYSPSAAVELYETEFENYENKVLENGEKDSDRLIKQIVGHGHCHDGETMVLTGRGYVFFKDLTKEDVIAQFDSQANFIGYTEKGDYNYIEQQYTGVMYTCESQSVNFRTSEEHKFIFGTRNAKGLRVDTIANLFKRAEFRVPNVAVGAADIDNRNYSPELIKLAGFIVGDGYWDAKVNKFTFHFSKQRKIDYLLNLVPEAVVYKNNDNTYKIYVDNPYDFDGSCFYTSEKEKIIPNVFLDCSPELLLDGLINSDGHTSKTNTLLYDTKSEPLMRQLCHYFTLAGVNYRLSDATCYKETGMYRFTIIKQGSLPFVKDARHKTERLIKEEVVDETIYCVETPSRFIATMRKGIPLIAGNTSTLEHITFNFAVNDVTRALLGQLTRHRIGWSYSVQSQRYVKQSTKSKHGVFKFVMPDFSYCKDLAAAELIVGNLLVAVNEAYDGLCALGVKAEDARAVLPMNSTCNLVVSCNLRALLDFVGKRGKGTHAQSEIQEMAELFWELVVAGEPWLETLREE